MIYKAEIEVTKDTYSQEDHWTDIRIRVLSDETLARLESKITKYIKKTEFTSTGDFGLTTGSASCKLIKKKIFIRRC